jgi:hypothetical protein
MNSLEKSYIYSETARSNQMNEELNKIYDVVRQIRTGDVDCDYVHDFRYTHCHSHRRSQSRSQSVTVQSVTAAVTVADAVSHSHG